MRSLVVYLVNLTVITIKTIPNIV